MKRSRIMAFCLLASWVGTIGLSTKVMADGAEFYWRATSIREASPPIDSTSPRATKTVVSGCSGDYPKHVGARCFKAEPCDKRNKSHYKFDGATTCDRKETIATDGSPMTYPAPSRGESLSCPDGYSDEAAGVCFKDCSGNDVKFGAVCRNERYGKCKIGTTFEDGACYASCPDGMTGVGPICSSTTPPGYIICGLGFSKTQASCAWTIADQTISAASLASALSDNFAGSEATMAERVATKLSKLDASAPKAFMDAAPDLIKFSSKYASEVSWMAAEAAKGAPSPATVRRMHSLVLDMISDFKSTERLKSVFSYMGLTVIPNIIEHSSGDTSMYPENTDDILMLVRTVTGFSALAIELAFPVPGPQTLVAAGLDVIGSYTYNVR